MKILHLASFDRWTGAAAIAFVEASSLRDEGVEASYAYVGGYSLEEKLDGLGWADPLLASGHGPVSSLRSLKALSEKMRAEDFDIVHSHLSHDHWLARLAISGRRKPALVRTFHSRRALRGDPLSKWLFASTDAHAVVNPALAESPAAAGLTPMVTPPPLEPQYVPEGDSVRAAYGVAEDVPVLGYIGKMSPGRGFEDAIEAFALVREEIPEARMLIIGHGPHRSFLEQLADRLDVKNALVWAGYRESDLPEHFRAMDLMLFAGVGSDEGHRAIIEANGCGTPVVSYPLQGVPFVVGEAADELVAREPSPASLAAIAASLLPEGIGRLRPLAVANASRFSYRKTAARLLELYRMAL